MSLPLLSPTLPSKLQIICTCLPACLPACSCLDPRSLLPHLIAPAGQARRRNGPRQMDGHAAGQARNAHPQPPAGRQSPSPLRASPALLTTNSATSVAWQSSASHPPCSAPGRISQCTSSSQHAEPALSCSRSIGVALPNGGTAGLFWNYVIGAIGLGFVYASIAELGSMSVSNSCAISSDLSRIPTSGGQYYWVAVLAPRPARRYLSYITGIICPPPCAF